MEICEKFSETTSFARKPAVGHMCPTASFLATFGFKF